MNRIRKYYIREEIVEGKPFHVIYVKWFGLFESFHEKWASPDTAGIRVIELNK